MFGSNNNGGYGNSGNMGYGKSQKKPEVPKDTPDWVYWVGFAVVFFLVCAVSMSADERKGFVEFIGWSWKVLAIGGLVVGGLFVWMSQATTVNEANSRGGLVASAFGFLLLILVIVGVLRGVGFIGDSDERGLREKPPFGIPFKMK